MTLNTDIKWFKIISHLSDSGTSSDNTLRAIQAGIPYVIKMDEKRVEILSKM